jgi:hypothetical protein
MRSLLKPMVKDPPWKRLDAALRTLSFTGYSTSSVTDAGIAELPAAVAETERTFTTLTQDFHWREIAGKLNALSNSVDYVAMRIDEGALDLVLGRTPDDPLDPNTEADFGGFLDRVLDDMKNAGRDFSFSPGTVGAAGAAIDAAQTGPVGTVAKEILPLIRFSGAINALVVDAVEEATPVQRAWWTSTDLSWRLDSAFEAHSAALTIWLWIFSTDEVLHGQSTGFDFGGGTTSIANLSSAEDLTQCLRFTRD